MTTRQINADELVAGHFITGDRMYPSGTLHLTVEKVTLTKFDNERTLVEVNATSGPYGISRYICYRGDDAITIQGGTK